MFHLDFEMYSGDYNFQVLRYKTVGILYGSCLRMFLHVLCYWGVYSIHFGEFFKYKVEELLSGKSFMKSRSDSRRTIWPYENVIALVQWTASENTNLLLKKMNVKNPGRDRFREIAYSSIVKINLILYYTL